MTLLETIKQLPDSPGIYQYFDTQGNLLYVGKAKNLKKRVKSYFAFTPTLMPNKKLSTRITKMIEQVISLNYIVVNSEHDALILENSLIKQLNPKYNILLRDDKTYPYIYINTSQKYPRFDITRKILKKSSITYFGPYSVGARDIVDSIYEIAQLVQNKGCLSSKKLCLYYQIKKCLGPCELPISQERYQREVNLGVELIQNKKLLLNKLEEKMLFYAQEMRFEEAAELRDRIERISRSEIKSDIDFATTENYDIIVLHNTQTKAVVLRLFMRDGKIISSTHDFIRLNFGYDEDELYQRAIIDFYTKNTPPKIYPILLSHKFEGFELVQEYLQTLLENKVSLIIPKVGKKKRLIELAQLNAEELLKKETKEDDSQLLKKVQELLSLERIPERVEIFDNSHMSGMATVGAMVVYEAKKFDKKGYRTYHLEAKDEYGQMRETLSRRITSFEKNPPPDLWILDGGTTLLSLALELLYSAGISLDVIAISKEKIDAKSHRAKGKANDILHNKNESFYLKNSDKRLQWVQNLRDEAHRSAITFHKKTKLKIDQESNLLKINGISQAKIIKLLNHFGTFESLKKVSLEEISEILNHKDAKLIKNVYN